MNKLMEVEEFLWDAYERTNIARAIKSPETKELPENMAKNTPFRARQFQKYTPPRIDRHSVVSVA